MQYEVFELPGKEQRWFEALPPSVKVLTDVIPNNMGINLCAVHSITRTMLDDGQLVQLVINFLPAKEAENG